MEKKTQKWKKKIIKWEIFHAILLQSSADLPWDNGALTQKRWRVSTQGSAQFCQFFFSDWFNTAMVVNPPERKQAKCGMN